MSNGFLTLAAGETATLDLGAVVSRLSSLVQSQVPAEYRPLTQKLSAFTGGTNDGKLPLKLLDFSAQPPVGDHYTLSLGAQATVTLDAYDNWPFPDDGLKDRLLSISASGALSAGGGLTIPFQFGSASASASGSVKVDLDYYFDVANADQLYALAVVQDLGGLVDPFQFKPLWDALNSGRLRGVVYRFTGTAAFKAGVSIAASENLVDLAALGQGAVKGALGAEIDVAATIDDDYTLSFFTIPTAGGKRSVVATLGRDQGVEKDLEATLGLTLDLSALGQYLRSLLKPALDTWQAELDTLKPCLSPGTWIQTQIKTDASSLLGPIFKDLVSNQDLRNALAQDAQVMLGVKPDPGEDPVLAWIRTQVANALDRVPGVRQALAQPNQAPAAASAAANAVVNELGGRFPAFVTSGIKDFVTSKVTSLIMGAQSKLQDEVDQLWKAPNQQLGAALTAAGARSTTIVTDLNSALAGVRSLFDKYDAILTKISNATEQAAKAKLTATVAFSEKSADSVAYRVRGTLDDDGAGAQDAFGKLIRGNLRELQGLLNQKTPGFTLTADKSSIGFTSTFDDSLGVDVVFLGLDLEAETLIHAEADVVVDGTGVVRVGLKGTVDAKYQGLNASQDITFFETESLVWSAAQSTSKTPAPMQMGFGIATQDKDLSHGLMSGFIKSLVGGGLLPSDAESRADGIVSGWLKSPGADKTLAGEFAVNMALDDASLQKLLQLRERPVGVLSPDAQLPPSAVQRIIQKALDAAEASGAIDGNDRLDLQDALEEIADQYRPALTSVTLANAIQYYDDRKVPRPDGPGIRQETQEVQSLIDWKDRILGVVKMIQIAGNLYRSVPQNPLAGGSGWTQQQYQKAEKDLAKAIAPWFMTDAFLFWLLPAAHPRTIALLNLVADLAGKSGAPPLALTLTYRPKTGDVKTAVVV